MNFLEAKLFGKSVSHLAKFDGEALFTSTEFVGDADFATAAFGGFAYFPDAKFGIEGSDSKASFVDCHFAKPTSFRQAIFKSNYPELAGAVLHDRTAFTDQLANWPKHKVNNPSLAKASCAVIRHSLGKQGLPEAEHFFFRKEMAFSGQIGAIWQRLPYVLFGWLSDYGYSISRPIEGLFYVWFIPALVFFFNQDTGIPADDIWRLFHSFALSFANLFPFFGFQKTYLETDIRLLNGWLQLLGGIQTVLSLPLVFFLGLGLRTRFRVR